MERADERTAHPLLQTVYYEGSSKKYYGKNANDISFEAQKEIILEDAAKGDSIFVGRCADVILKENTNYEVKSIFFTAPIEFRVRQTMATDCLSEKEALAKVRKMDKLRKAFYNYYTGKDWGKASNYDYCVNTESNSKEEMIALLMHVYES